MKLKYLLAPLAIAAAALFTTACEDNDKEPDVLGSLQVSQSYLNFGGTATETQTITLTAKEDWYFVTDEDELTNWGLDAIPEWLTISPMSGSAGEYSVNFTASEYDGTDNCEIGIRVGTTTQFFKIYIGEETEPELVSIAEVLAGQDGVTYRTAGYCTLIVNTTYGNWYLTDDAGDQIYIYGTVDSGGSYDWDGIGIELGDYVTVQGPRSTYGSTIELVDASVISIVKNLISIDTEAEEIAKEGGEATVVLSVSGDGVTVTIPDDAKSWLSVTGIETSDGSATVTFYATANDGVDRSTTVEFSTVSGGTTYSTETTISQAGSILDATAAEINAAEDGGSYRVTGYITDLANTTYGNYYITDYSGSVYVYGTLDADGNTKNFSSLGINEGDIVTVTGPKGSYNGTSQLANVSVESHYAVTDVTIAEFLAAAEASDVYYRISGTITSITNSTYGNLYLEDETGSVLVYGAKSGWGGASSSFSTLDPLPAEGDELTVVGVRTSYGDTQEMGSCFIVAHTQGSGDSGSEGGEEGGDEGDDTTTTESGYSEVTEITSGGTYLFVVDNDGTNIAFTALDETDSYGYANGTTVTVSEGTITSSDLSACEFIVTSSENGYTIVDYLSRYYYQSGSFNSFNVTTEPSSGYEWTFAYDSTAGTFTITNVEMSKYIQYSTSYSSFGAYSYENGLLPKVYKKAE